MPQTEAKTEDLAQTSPVKKLHELYKKCDHSERYSTRILSSAHPAIFIQQTTENIGSQHFFPDWIRQSGKKSWIQKYSFRKRQHFCTIGACCSTLELPKSYTNTQPFIHSCWHRLDASSYAHMHVNTLHCDYSNVTLKRTFNDASDRRRVRS